MEYARPGRRVHSPAVVSHPIQVLCPSESTSPYVCPKPSLHRLNSAGRVRFDALHDSRRSGSSAAIGPSTELDDIVHRSSICTRTNTTLIMQNGRGQDRLQIEENDEVTNERVIAVPWALSQLPQFGVVLDVGSCDAMYLAAIPSSDRRLHCLDPRDCTQDIPPDVVFLQQSIIGNTLPRAFYDAILGLSTVEHIGLPCYGQKPFSGGDQLALVEFRELLRPGGRLVLTVPAGQSKISSWYRQYSPTDLEHLLVGWQSSVAYWGFDGSQYVPIPESEVTKYDYRDRYGKEAGAGAFAGIVARL